MKKLIAVVGATAVGKTALAIRLAQHFQTDIVSADSRQYYIELDKGTAKPSPEELAMAKHYGINSHHITDYYSVGQFEQDALQWIADIHQRTNIAILVGGSGLYVKAVTDGLDEMPDIDLNIRQILQARLEQEGLPALLQELEQVDEIYFQQVDKANPQRIIRALEVCLSVGKPYSSFRAGKPKERPFQVIKVGLAMPREELYSRIEARMELMLQNGLVEEAQGLLAYADLPALQTVGYQEVFAYLKNEYDWKEAHRLLMRNSRRYAKRQNTWFNRQENIMWFQINQWEEILQYIESQNIVA
jgi:tRNA dimethylallyltransferase